MPLKESDAGVSLIEMAVAVLILSIAVVGLFRVYDTNIHHTSSQRDRALALIVAQNRAESIALGLRDLPAQVRLAGRAWDIETASTATRGGFAEMTLRATPSTGGAGAILTTYSADPAQ